MWDMSSWGWLHYMILYPLQALPLLLHKVWFLDPVVVGMWLRGRQLICQAHDRHNVYMCKYRQHSSTGCVVTLSTGQSTASLRLDGLPRNFKNSFMFSEMMKLTDNRDFLTFFLTLIGSFTFMFFTLNSHVCVALMIGIPDTWCRWDCQQQLQLSQSNAWEKPQPGFMLMCHASYQCYREVQRK